MKKRNISLFYVKGLTVLGDEIIYETSKFLLQKICSEESIDVEFSSYGFMLPAEYLERLIKYSKSVQFLWNAIYYKCLLFGFDIKFLNKFIFNLIFILKILYCLKLYYFDKNLRFHYENMVKNSDVVFFCGGGLFQQFYMNMWSGIFLLLKTCKKKNVPVYFNAIGIEKPETWAEKIFYRYIMNNKIIKFLTVRENSDFVNNCLLKSDKKCAQVLDSALFAQECYGVEKLSSDVIGIGAIRAEIFSDNNCGVTRNEVLYLYAGLIKEIEKRGYKWQLFTNGGKKDYRFAQEIIKFIEAPEEKLAPFANNSMELMNTIKNYKAVIAGHLHSVILAVALDIPASGIVWTPKFIHFQKFLKLGKFITPDKFSYASFIIDELEKSIEIGIDEQHKLCLKQYTYSILKENIKKLLEN